MGAGYAWVQLMHGIELVHEFSLCMGAGCALTRNLCMDAGYARVQPVHGYRDCVDAAFLWVKHLHNWSL